MKAPLTLLAFGALGLCACTSPDDAGQSSAGAGNPSSAGNSGSGSGTGANGSGGSSSNAGQTGGGQASVAGNGSSGSGMSGSGMAGTGQCEGSSAGGPPATQCEAAGAEFSEPARAALAAVNELRSHMGLGCMALVPEINVASQKHCDYYQLNIENKPCIANAHGEVETCAGFVAASFGQRMTLAGYTGSPRSEVMAFSGDPGRAVAMWINSVYHRTPLVSPWVREMGYGGTADCDTVDLGQGPETSDDATALYPYPGQTDIPTEFDGSREGPMPPEPPSGWPSASPVHLYVQDFTVESHEIFASAACDPLPHQWLDDSESYYILYPDQPFQNGTEYRVRISGTKGGEPLTFDWTFTTEN
jgi:hypothetical protein